MSNDVKISVSGNDAQMISVWQRQNAQILKNQKALIAMGNAGEQAGQKIGNSLDRGAKQGNAALSGALAQVRQFAGAFIGISAVVKGLQFAAENLKREYEHLRGQQTRAGARQTELAPLQREVFENLGDDKTLSPQMANVKVADISQRTSMSPGDVMKVLSTALSFKERSASAASVLPLVEMAAQMSPESGDAAAANVKALQAISKIDPKAKAKDIQGFLLGAKLASPVVNAENFGAYTAPGIAQLMSLGNTAKEAAAFQGALGQGIGDEEGRVTATSSITFAKQLKELTAGKVKGGLFQQLAFLQTPAGQRAKKKLLGPLMESQKNAKKIGLEGEAKAFATLVGFIQGEGRYQEILQGTLEDTPDLEGAGSYVDTREKALAADPLQKNFRMQRLIKSSADRAQLGQLGAGRQGITIGGLKELFTNAGASELEVEALMEAYKVRTEGAPEGFTARVGQGLGLLTAPGELQTPDKAAAGVMRYEAGRLERGEQAYKSGTAQTAVTNEMSEAARSLRMAADLLEEGQKKNEPPMRPKAGPGAANQRGAQN